MEMGGWGHHWGGLGSELEELGQHWGLWGQKLGAGVGNWGLGASVGDVGLEMGGWGHQWGTWGWKWGLGSALGGGGLGLGMGCAAVALWPVSGLLGEYWGQGLGSGVRIPGVWVGWVWVWALGPPGFAFGVSGVRMPRFGAGGALGSAALGSGILGSEGGGDWGVFWGRDPQDLGVPTPPAARCPPRGAAEAAAAAVPPAAAVGRAGAAPQRCPPRSCGQG